MSWVWLCGILRALMGLASLQFDKRFGFLMFRVPFACDGAMGSIHFPLYPWSNLENTQVRITDRISAMSCTMLFACSAARWNWIARPKEIEETQTKKKKNKKKAGTRSPLVVFISSFLFLFLFFLLEVSNWTLRLLLNVLLLWHSCLS